MSANNNLKEIRISFSSKRVIIVSFLILAGLLRLLFGIPFHLVIFILMFGWFLSTFLFLKIIEKQKTENLVKAIHFIWFVLELLLLTVIVHYLGGIEWIGIIFYTLFCIYGAFLFTKKLGFLVVWLGFALYAGLVILEYFAVVPHHTFIKSVDPSRDFFYVFTTLILAGGLFYFLAFSTDLFAERLREKTRRLAKLSEVLEETKASLEIKIEARLKELKELNESLEERVKERTLELEEKVKELERFQKLAVGRELRMIELKKEIQALKAKLKNHGAGSNKQENGEK